MIKILNVSLLLFAGFLAGTHFSSHDDKATLSLTAHRAAPSSVTARGPASVDAQAGNAPNSSPMSLSAPAAKDANEPVDLAAYLLKFGIADVHAACEFAHNRFLDRTVAAHASFVEGLENFKDHKAYLNALGQRLAEDEKFWIGRGDLDINGGKARLEVIMDSHAFLPDAGDEDKASCFRAHIRLNFADGHKFATAVDACTDMLVTKNRNYYLNWESFGDLEIGKSLAVVQIPLPESNGADLEFMRSSGSTWASAAGFHWDPVPLDQGLRLIDQI